MTEQPTPYAAPAAPQPTSTYAEWADRAVAFLWDLLYGLPPLGLMFLSVVPIVAGGVTDDGDGGNGLSIGLFVLGGLMFVGGLVWSLWRQINNQVVRQGRTGQTWGKAKVGIWVLDQHTGAVPGWGSCLARLFLHGLINQAFYLDYLWPLWDPQKQTLTDKILSTVVIKRA